MTPRHGAAACAGQGMQTPRGSVPTGMRGSIASMAWTEGAPDVPWITFTSRISGAEIAYGQKRDLQSPNEEGTFSLRRGEYFTSISGVFGAPPALALCLRLVTSEFQEINLGTEDPDVQFDFAFEASSGFEIVGLQLGEDEAVVGIRQSPLAPSRVSAAQPPVYDQGTLSRRSVSPIKETPDEFMM